MKYQDEINTAFANALGIDIANRELLPHQARVVLEEQKLSEDLCNLNNFLSHEIFKTLDAAERSRLHRQSIYMTLYANVLKERIAAFRDSVAKL